MPNFDYYIGSCSVKQNNFAGLVSAHFMRVVVDGGETKNISFSFHTLVQAREICQSALGPKLYNLKGHITLADAWETYDKMLMQ